jgi:hypothetical protein
MRASGLELSLSGTYGGDGWASLDGGLSVALNRTKALDLGSMPDFVLDEVAWIRRGYPTPVIIGFHLRNPDEIAEPDAIENHIFGPNNPTRTVGGNAAIRLRSGAELAARVEYRGGNFLFDNASTSLLSQGVHPRCNKAYALLAANGYEQLTAWERVYCRRLTVRQDGSIVPGDFMRLRDLSLSLPLPGERLRLRNATLVLAARNYLIWKTSGMKVFDPEMGGRDGMFAIVNAIETAVPTPASLGLSIRATYW